MIRHLAPALVATALLGACAAPVAEVESGPRASGTMGFVSPCTVLESTAVKVTVPVDGSGKVLGSLSGGLAGTILGPVGTAGGAAAGAAAGSVADRFFARVDGVEYVVRRNDEAEISVTQDIATGERILTAGSDCRVRTDQSSGTARVLPPLPAT